MIESSASADIAALEARLTDCAAKLSDLADSLGSGDLVDHLKAVTKDCHALVEFLRQKRQQTP
jgi:hypothetical protein